MMTRANYGLDKGLRKSVAALLSIAVLSVMSGLMTAILPWWFVVSFAVIPAFIATVVVLPEIAVALVIAAYFGLFPESLLPRLPMFGGRLAPEDLGVICLLVVLCVRHAGSVFPRLGLVKAYLPVFVFLFATVVTSVAFSLGINGVPRKDVLNELRPFFAWLLLPLCVLAVDSEDRLRRFRYALFVIALLLSVGVVFQSISGIHVLSKGQFMELGTLGERHSDISRSTTPGMFLISASLLYVIATFVSRGVSHRFLFIGFALLLCGGIIVGFGRGLWVSFFMGLGLICIFMWGARCIRVMLIAAGIGVLGLAAVYMAKPKAVEIVAERILSIGDELRYGDSYGRRKTENAYALERVRESPLLGVGLGAEYKPSSAQSLSWLMETRYIHNSYVSAATKLGIPGLASIVSLVGLLGVRAWRAARLVQFEARPLAISALWVILAAGILTSFTQPNLMSPYGVVSIAVAAFFVETSLRRRGFDGDVSAGAFGVTSPIQENAR